MIGWQFHPLSCLNILRYLYPEIEIYETTGREDDRQTTLKKAERYLEDDILSYLLVTAPVTFPKNPSPLFEEFKFPSTYHKFRGHGSWEHVKQQLAGAISDF
jgi:hypothetical protein